MHRSDRGFVQGDRIKGHYGGTARVYESSGMTPAIWLQIAVPEPNNHRDPDAPIVEKATILLTLDNAKALEKQLKYLRKNHFLGE